MSELKNLVIENEGRDFSFEGKHYEYKSTVTSLVTHHNPFTDVYVNVDKELGFMVGCADGIDDNNSLQLYWLIKCREKVVKNRELDLHRVCQEFPRV